MNNAVATLNEIAKDWATSGSVPEVDWSRIRAFEFQEALKSRNDLAQKLAGKACLSCDNFKDHVRLCQFHYQSALELFNETV